jgi:uncharacterized protein (TIGR03118 family)
MRKVAGSLVIAVLILGLGFSARADEPSALRGYNQVNLTSDLAASAGRIDLNLVNPWGIAVRRRSQIWVAGNGTGLATAYRPNGKFLPTVVTIPGPALGGPGTPAGLAFNTTQDFVISNGARSARSVLLFATEDGVLSGWNPTVDPDNAIVTLDRSDPNRVNNAVYKGIALGQSGGNNFLYVTNFRGGVVDVYDGAFNFVKSFRNPASDLFGYGPFGIRNIDGKLYVTYALQDATLSNDVPGPGNGFIDVFDTSGNLISRFASQGTLNSPWGLALAPKRFGAFSQTLLVSNSGDGLINAFDPQSGLFLGQLKDRGNNPIVIDGLRGLDFNQISVKIKTKVGLRPALFFAAGISGGNHGLFGYLLPFVAAKK